MLRALAVAVILALLSANMITGSTVLSQSNLDRAIAYIRTTAYNSTLHLCREAPRVAPNTYWVASDNLLAFKAIEPFDPELSSTIRSELAQLAKTYNLPRSRDGVPLSLRYDVVMRDDETLEIPPRNVTHLILYSGQYVLKYDIANGTGSFGDWKRYSDLLLLVALSDHNRGDQINAVGNMTAAASMWDGVGLRDLAFNNTNGEGQAPGYPHTYATYKLGLLLFVSGKLGRPLPFEKDLVNRIWSMQNETSGGIFTHIAPDGGRNDSDTNTETTALVILGMTSITPVSEVGVPVLVLCVIFAMVVVVARRPRQRRFEVYRI